ncbi:MAG TPA: hypothetical protein PKH07_17975 [bacterium]|nr:hypothetical protein [bacterium]
MWNERDAVPSSVTPDKRATVLLFMSKWANYTYREKTEWLHDAQFGVYRMFTQLGIPTRIICEDNLDEDLSGYRAIFRAFSPVELLSSSQRNKLEAVPLPTIIDVPSIPSFAANGKVISASGELGKVDISIEGPCPMPLDLSGFGSSYQHALSSTAGSQAAHKPGVVILGYPIGLVYLKGRDRDAQLALLTWALAGM